MIPPSLLVIYLSIYGWGLIDLPPRASNEESLRPRVARAQKIIRLHPFLSQLHSSNEHFLLLLVSPGGVAEAALYCAHRTSTFLSCAFREQEDDQAALTLFIVESPRAATSLLGFA
jgi:hypothetical protein